MATRSHHTVPDKAVARRPADDQLNDGGLGRATIDRLGDLPRDEPGVAALSLSVRRPVLAAKLMVPLLRPGVVVRSRLHDRLRATSGAPLTTVIAPAGWGKTTLLAAWANDPGEHRRVGWLSIDEADDEPVRFWTYALSALNKVVPQVAGDALAALGGPDLHPLDVALPTLLNALEAANEECVLVLDDYHVLTDRAIHESVEFMLSYMPSALRLVIAGRSDPPLPLARMRARRLLDEIDVDELRCTPAEGAALVSGVVEVASTTVGELVERTEGWPAGLHLAALRLRSAAQPDVVAATIRGDERHILDYFASEVLEGLDAEQRDLLVRTSVLERLCGSLCDAVLARTGSVAVLDRLERAHAFVTGLGGPWYRCHHLFREALRRELDITTPGQVSVLLVRAADWFLAQGDIEGAVAHRLEAGDGAGALDLLTTYERWFLDRGATTALLRFGEWLAASVIDARFYVTLAFTAGTSGLRDRCVMWLQAAEPLIEPDSEPMLGWRSLRAGADATWAAYGVLRDPDAALDFATRAAEQETDPTVWGYVLARHSLAGALLSADRVPEAVQALRDCWHAPVRNDLPTLLTLQCAGMLAIVLVEVGEPQEARCVITDVAGAADAAARAWGAGAAAALARLRLAEGRLLAARDPAESVPTLREAAELAEGWGREPLVVAALTSLAEAQWATGDHAGARANIERARDVADEMPRHRVTVKLAELEARLGRGAGRSARRVGALLDELTDRELAVLRALRGPLSSREIGAELFLSINTVKGYTKSLYRKLGVVTRVDAVHRGKELGLI